MKWLNSLKISIIQNDLDALSKLLEEDVTYETISDMEEATYLLNSALQLIESKKSENIRIRSKIDKNRQFLKQNNSKATNRLDITS